MIIIIIIIQSLSSDKVKEHNPDVRFKVFTAVTMKNSVFWDVTPSGPCKNRRFGGA
jgi:hypothetical protein